MSSVIYKHKLVKGSNKVDLPQGAEILSIGFQGQDLVLWYKFDEILGSPKETRYLNVIFTGEFFDEADPEERKFIGTAQNGDMGAGIVVHVFEEKYN